jgi:pimeloyl-ACP methyl ester carboxylesterase
VRDTGLINEWETVPYDWRLDFPALLANGKKDGENISYLESTTTPYIMQELRHLVATSRTGKVTIIGHSNGGLLAKYILDTLEKSHDPLLDHIDKLILVAVPQIGTPKAVAGMLHGTGLDIPEDIGFLMNRPTARTLAQNMQSGYNLIPSPAYFATVATPLITFTNSPTTQLFRNYYGESITSGSELHDFLLGAEGRTKPTANHVTEPEILNGALLPIAEAHHLALDAWVPPASMQVIQIAGWGVDTVSGINYDAIDPCAASGDPSCPILAPAPSDTLDGDGTVVDPSASWMSTSTLNVERWWVDLEKKNNTKIINRNHADILEVSELNDFIKSVISGGRATDTLAIIANKKPSTSDASRRLRFTLHSPVDMHLYDAFGHHTGVVANPNPLSDIRLYEQNIPNSYYREFGEAKYAGVNTGSSTIVRLTGLALGSFTFDIDEIGGNGTITASTTFVDIPVTASTTGVLSIPGGGLSTTPTSTPMLLLDIDGDGTSDLSLVGNVGGITDEELVAVLRGVVKTLHLPANKEKQLLKKIDKLAKELAKEHKNQKIERRKTRQVFVGLQKTITRYEKKSILTGEEASELQSIVEQIRGSVVK